MLRDSIQGYIFAAAVTIRAPPICLLNVAAQTRKNLPSSDSKLEKTQTVGSLTVIQIIKQSFQTRNVVKMGGS